MNLNSFKGISYTTQSEMLIGKCASRYNEELKLRVRLRRAFVLFWAQLENESVSLKVSCQCLQGCVVLAPVFLCGTSLALLLHR